MKRRHGRGKLRDETQEEDSKEGKLWEKKPLKRKHESGTLGKPRKIFPIGGETLGEETVEEEA